MKFRDLRNSKLHVLDTCLQQEMESEKKIRMSADVQDTTEIQIHIKLSINKTTINTNRF